MGIKHIYNRFTKRIWNPRVYNYSFNYRNALKNTQELGLDIQGIPKTTNYCFLPDYKQFVINEILNKVYYRDGKQLEDLLLKCNVISKQLQGYLKTVFDIESVITTGNVYNNRLRVNYEPLSVLKKRLSNKNYDKPFISHTWLTLENLDIIDLTIAPNLWFDLEMSGTKLSRSDFQKILWISTYNFDRRGLVYEPLILGYEYFQKVNLPVKIIQM